MVERGLLTNMELSASSLRAEEECLSIIQGARIAQIMLTHQLKMETWSASAESVPIGLIVIN
jgi:hypothetical protein